MGKLKIKLNNGFEFDADVVNETGNVNNETKSITISLNLIGENEGDVGEIEKNITTQSMGVFTVAAENKQFEYKGFTDNIITNKTITNTMQSLFINASKS